jgi:hypothetical protein
VPTFPGVDDSLARLRRSGWSVGDAAFGGGGSLVWQVDGQNGENQVRAEGASQVEAWHRACQQAEAVELPQPKRPRGRPRKET